MSLNFSNWEPKRFVWGGSANMGDVNDETVQPRIVVARMIVPIYFRCHFSAGTGTAAFDVRIDNDNGPDYDWKLVSVGSRGTGSDLNLRILREEWEQFIIHPKDALVPEWANPDPAVMRWALEIGYLERP